MSNYTSSNLRMLDQQFHQALRNFNEADPLDAEAPGTIEIPTGETDVRELTVAPKTYRDKYQNRFSSIDSSDGVLCLGSEDPSHLTELGSRLSPEDKLVYAEVDPRRFERVLDSINLIRLGSECDLEVLFDQSIPDLILKACLTLEETATESGDIRSLVAPGLFVDLLGSEDSAGEWTKMVVTNRHHNQIQTAGNDSDDPAVQPYEKLLDLTEAAVLNAGGVGTFFREAVEPHEVDDVEPVSIVVEAADSWDTTKRCLESIFNAEYETDPDVLLASRGELDMAPEAFDFLRKSDWSPSIKTLDPTTHRSLRNSVVDETAAETLVFVDGRTRIREEGWLSKLLSPLTLHPKVGMSGSHSTIISGDATENALKNTWLSGLPMPVSYTGGNCFAIRSRMLDTLGGWDSPSYEKKPWSHLDLQWSLRDRGWMTVAPGQAPLVETDSTLNDTIEQDVSEKSNDYRTFVNRWGSLDRVPNTAGNRKPSPEDPVTEDRSGRKDRKTA
jgi:hypothetical protein